jgi:hypothetical protein
MKGILRSKKVDLWSNKYITGAICTYEVFAVGTHKVPSLTQIMHRRPWLKPLFVGTLALHLLNEKE